MHGAALVSRSGGLVYHLRANQYRSGPWRPFCEAVACWLADWPVPRRQLLLVGPSGGYSLPAGFLQSFDQVLAIEPDPIARWMLRSRFRGIAFEFIELDCFADLDGPARLAAAFPQAVILFCNVIGQLLEFTPPGWREALLRALAGHHWASYHDVISTAQPPARAVACTAAPTDTLEAVLAKFWKGGELPLHDHLSFALSGQAGRYMVWALTPTRHHLIEWQVQQPV